MAASKQPEPHGGSEEPVPGGGGAECPSESLPLHRLDVATPATLPFAIGTFDTIGPLSRATFPHRHVFYELVYVTEGSGAHTIDLTAWPLRPPQLCVILPGQVHHWDRVSDLRGWVILFSEDFLLGNPDDRDALRDLGGRPCPTLAPDDAPGFARLIADMRAEHDARSVGFTSVLRAYLHVLIVRARRLPCAPATRVAGAPAAVTREFTRLLHHVAPSRRSVNEYAEQLGVSVAYLSESVKQATGVTPAQHIRRAHVLEAKRLLSGTDLTVRQVARKVGFADPAYFSRFFRRETGMTPGTFRWHDRGNHHDPHRGSIAFPGSAP